MREHEARITFQTEESWCDDIGMFTINRPRSCSCVHKTAYCALHCYNLRVELQYDAIPGKDARTEVVWQEPSAPEAYARAFDRKTKKQTHRVRLMSRGEAFASVDDIDRVLALAAANPHRIFWIPTRAWRNDTLRKLIEARVMVVPNIVLLASLDPTNTEREYRLLRNHGWPTMFFGIPEPHQWAGPSSVFRCPKTHRPKRSKRNPHGLPAGHCAVCKAGCFAPTLTDRLAGLHTAARRDVFLREH